MLQIETPAGVPQENGAGRLRRWRSSLYTHAVAVLMGAGVGACAVGCFVLAHVYTSTSRLVFKGAIELLQAVLVWPLVTVVFILVFQEHVIALLGRLKSGKLGDLQVEFQALNDKIDAVDSKATLAVAVAADAQATAEKEDEEKETGPADDPWKGFARGSSIDKNRGLELTASVVKVPGRFERYAVELCVARFDSTKAPLQGDVVFYLHPSFLNYVRTVHVDGDGRATLSLIAWGGFTVGAKAADGSRLELDLATLNGAPEPFRLR